MDGYPVHFVPSTSSQAQVSTNCLEV